VSILFVVACTIGNPGIGLHMFVSDRDSNILVSKPECRITAFIYSGFRFRIRGGGCYKTPLNFDGKVDVISGVCRACASGGAATVLGPGDMPGPCCLAQLCATIHLSTDPDFCAFGAFGQIKQIRMEKLGSGFPFVLIGLVRAGDIDGIETFIFPDGCGGQSYFELMGR